MSNAVTISPRTTSRSDLYRVVHAAMEVEKYHRGRTIGVKTRLLHDRLYKLMTGMSRTAKEVTIPDEDAEALKQLSKIIAIGASQVPDDVAVVLGWIDVVCN